MANSGIGRKRFGSAAFTAILLAGWIAVVIVGAGERPEDDPLLGVQNFGYVLFGILVLCALCGLVLLIYLAPRRSDEEFMPPYKRKQPWIFLLAVFVLFWIWRPDYLAQSNAQTQAETQEAGADLLEIEPEPAADSVAQLTDLILVAIGIAVVAGIWMLARRRLDEEAPLPQEQTNNELAADLLMALDDASTELAASDDPRVGVLNAYASLERALAGHDRIRRPSETPTEHVRRAVAQLHVDPAPLAQLGDLYSLARFSSQEITADQLQLARQALERARNELAAQA